VIIINGFRILVEKNRELLLYAFYGGLSFLLNIGLFYVLNIFLDYWVANIITLVVLKIFIFITNKFLVFCTPLVSFKQLMLEAGRFLGSRIITNLIDFFGLIFAVEILAADEFYSKIVIQIIVITLNYILSKLFVFKKKSIRESEETIVSGKLTRNCKEEDEVKYETKNFIAKMLVRGFYSGLNDLLKSIEFESVYDVGCGAGHITEFVHLQYPEVDIQATDIDEDKLSIARERVKDVDFKSGDIYNIDRLDDSFDLVISTEVLEHLENPLRALNELLRISKRYLIISVPNEPIWSFANMARFKYLKSFGNTPGHINRWSERSFEGFAGSTAVVIDRRTPFPYTILLCEKRQKTHNT